MLGTLKKKVLSSNLDLVDKGLVIYTWGNVSGLSEDRRYMVIKPSGVDYGSMTEEDMVVVEIGTGRKVEGKWKPSSDTLTHLEIYRAFPTVFGITHTHSPNAVAFAQAGMDIPALGTTHADYFYGAIPCTRGLHEEEVKSGYEVNTGKVIVETVNGMRYDPMMIPGILVKSHGPFTWGKDAAGSVYNAVVMERVSEIALKTLMLKPDSSMDRCILDKDYMRKHGTDACYGQNEYPAVRSFD